MQDVASSCLWESEINARVIGRRHLRAFPFIVYSPRHVWFVEKKMRCRGILDGFYMYFLEEHCAPRVHVWYDIPLYQTEFTVKHHMYIQAMNKNISDVHNNTKYGKYCKNNNVHCRNKILNNDIGQSMLTFMIFEMSPTEWEKSVNHWLDLTINFHVALWFIKVSAQLSGG